MKVTFAKSAVRDLESIGVWYAEQGAADAGVRFVSEIFEQVERLTVHPPLGRNAPAPGRSSGAPPQNASRPQDVAISGCAKL
jgi:plasmid stabilization system protein ParE